MPLVSFEALMAQAEQGQYAVGYFESWNLESLLAVADAAESAHSPVILGFSGIYLTHPHRVVTDPLSAYAALGLDICSRLSVPACLLFNESPQLDRVFESMDLGFNLVMFSDDDLGWEEQVGNIAQVVDVAHQRSVAVEAELAAPPGLGGNLSETPVEVHLDDPAVAQAFVEETGIDALAVSIGQAHLHGRSLVPLNFSRLDELRDLVSVPLVLHGASSVSAADMRQAIRLGIRKVNVGSVLKINYFEAMRCASLEVQPGYNPYDIMGSGFDNDVMTTARMAVQKTVEELMVVFGSADQAW